ncbi:dehydrogenase/reductase SDR family member 11-like [Xyrichtys novacula]|uniref:Dehydrogenase/reductase SDR family member 11 n=1 Tax=Xyrichtys novacula TaxID=13765 RepID=A0AAV1FVE3_XYRNO|nr:dehydrogenase/reductase SDR family member 11-like [Xyrichtys novacula]
MRRSRSLAPCCVHEHLSQSSVLTLLWLLTSPGVSVCHRAEMDRWRGRVALVTGASVGIGAAIAKELVRHGMKVVGCARDVGRIQKLAAECQSAGYSGVLLPYKCDLTKEEDILSMFSAIKSRHKGVDVCINNAGLAHPEPLLSGRTSGWKEMFDVNVLALCICTREAYQSMKERNVDDGQIIHINSMTGHRVVPSADVHVYCATKFAVTALLEGLRLELREANTHIRASCISPGVVETEFTQRLYRDKPEIASTFPFFDMKPLEAVDVANAVTFVLSAPPHVQIGEVQMRPVRQVL